MMNRRRAAMPNQLIEIYPVIPASLARLPELASNLFFSWHRPTRALFEDLEPELWQQVGGNLRLMLRCINQENLDRAAADRIYQERYRQVVESFDAYLSAPQRADGPLVAYFCAEYGFHESFPIYSGGLGILAGDHCKAASDERLNFVAVGLLYTQGYFIQSVDSDGVQHASNTETDPRDLPVEAVRDASGDWMQVTVRIAGRNVVARIWKAQVGRVSVYLLDTNCKENVTEDREITHRLYGGDASVRIRQEMILGLGGVRALRALGMAPAVWHMNEGHAAFLILELVREGVANGLDFSAALESAATQCVFTTHTPVGAGHDAFDMGLFTHCFQDMFAELDVSVERVLDLGRVPNASHAFNMTHLALNGARRMNGVSRIHGAVSSRLCAEHWPEVPAEQNPVGYVTNGVHVPTFLAQTWSRFFDGALGPEWRAGAAVGPRLLACHHPGAGSRFLGDGATGQGAHAPWCARPSEPRVSRQGPESGAAAPNHAVARPRAPRCTDARFCATLRDLQARLVTAARSRTSAQTDQVGRPSGTVSVRRQSSSRGSTRQAGAARDT